MTDDNRNELADCPGVTIFDSLEFAMEEAEFMHKTTGTAYSIVACPTKTGEIDQYLVMEKSRALATAAFVLETFRNMDNDKALGVH